ncbi:MAG: hypothetical protein A2X86_13020 [Bdellovibrionales bacterium GWA2_49_15]|nr:MAG: hypothetical protein A2X86_13020 [Bdellovibrionales bacterium GWA2_49_15]HAZ13907.1 hypothetical protein [Bdellovibrionales bacterium]
MEKIKKEEENGNGIGIKSGSGNGNKARRSKTEKQVYIINKEQTKFFVDASGDKQSLDLIFDLLARCNQKTKGREITFKDICLLALPKITDKDIERLQEVSLSEMEKVQRALEEFNQKNGTNLELGEFLVKKLNIN